MAATKRRRVLVSSAVAEPGDPSDGIYGFEQDPSSGALLATGAFTPAPAASFVSLDPTGTRAYAVEARPVGGVAAFSVAPDGGLAPLGVARTGGAGPCHLAVHPGNRLLLAAHYDSGHLSVHRLGPDGAIGDRCDLVRPEGSGPDPERQEHAHAHFVWPEPSGRFVLLVDLGTDSVRTYALDQGSGRLEEVRVGRSEPGSGPRHLRLHPDGYLLVTGELGASLLRFDYDPEQGAATWRLGVPASQKAGRGDNYPSELAFSQDHRFCYVANRGPDTLGVFSLEQEAPVLVAEVPTEGAHPRHLAVIGEYLYVANQESASVVAFALDRASGLPRPVSSVALPRPFCVRALP